MAADKGVTVRYFAAAKAAAGTTEEVRPLPDPATLAGLAADLREVHGSELGTVLDRSSFLLDQVSARAAAPLTAGSVVDVLPPFAGG
ncbi:MAG: MoaD/ThiS family protein [Actinomycetota bacterium]|nr:MoaD/ThiS family protein [Actinomycetota bacterium]